MKKQKILKISLLSSMIYAYYGVGTVYATEPTKEGFYFYNYVKEPSRMTIEEKNNIADKVKDNIGKILVHDFDADKNIPILNKYSDRITTTNKEGYVSKYFANKDNPPNDQERFLSHGEYVLFSIFGGNENSKQKEFEGFFTKKGKVDFFGAGEFTGSYEDTFNDERVRASLRNGFTIYSDSFGFPVFDSENNERHYKKAYPEADDKRRDESWQSWFDRNYAAGKIDIEYPYEAQLTTLAKIAKENPNFLWVKSKGNYSYNGANNEEGVYKEENKDKKEYSYESGASITLLYLNSQYAPDDVKALRKQVIEVANYDYENKRLDSYSSLCHGDDHCVSAIGKIYTGMKGKDGSNNGTSFSAPYVASLAAAIKSIYPFMTAEQIKDLILSNADKLIDDPEMNKVILGAGVVNPLKSSKGIEVLKKDYEVNLKNNEDLMESNETFEFANNISGVGGLTINGNNKNNSITLKGDNSYEGKTLVKNKGKLILEQSKIKNSEVNIDKTSYLTSKGSEVTTLKNSGNVEGLNDARFVNITNDKDAIINLTKSYFDMMVNNGTFNGHEKTEFKNLVNNGVATLNQVEAKNNITNNENGNINIASSNVNKMINNGNATLNQTEVKNNITNNEKGNLTINSSNINELINNNIATLNQVEVKNNITNNENGNINIASSNVNELINNGNATIEKGKITNFTNNAQNTHKATINDVDINKALNEINANLDMLNSRLNTFENKGTTNYVGKNKIEELKLDQQSNNKITLNGNNSLEVNKATIDGVLTLDNGTNGNIAINQDPIGYINATEVAKFKEKNNIFDQLTNETKILTSKENITGKFKEIKFTNDLNNSDYASLYFFNKPELSQTDKAILYKEGFNNFNDNDYETFKIILLAHKNIINNKIQALEDAEKTPENIAKINKEIFANSGLSKLIYKAALSNKQNVDKIKELLTVNNIDPLYLNISNEDIFNHNQKLITYNFEESEASNGLYYNVRNKGKLGVIQTLGYVNNIDEGMNFNASVNYGKLKNNKQKFDYLSANLATTFKIADEENETLFNITGYGHYNKNKIKGNEIVNGELAQISSKNNYSTRISAGLLFHNNYEVVDDFYLIPNIGYEYSKYKINSDNAYSVYGLNSGFDIKNSINLNTHSVLSGLNAEYDNDDFNVGVAYQYRKNLKTQDNKSSSTISDAILNIDYTNNINVKELNKDSHLMNAHINVKNAFINNLNIGLYYNYELLKSNKNERKQNQNHSYGINIKYNW